MFKPYVTILGCWMVPKIHSAPWREFPLVPYASLRQATKLAECRRGLHRDGSKWCFLWYGASRYDSTYTSVCIICPNTKISTELFLNFGALRYEVWVAHTQLQQCSLIWLLTTRVFSWINTTSKLDGWKVGTRIVHLGLKNSGRRACTGNALVVLLGIVLQV